MSVTLSPFIKLLRTPEEAVKWLRSASAMSLQTDSRRLQAGQAFVAWPGAAHDARQYVLCSLKNGASACLTEAHGAENFDFTHANALPEKITKKLALYQGLRKDTGPIAASFYDYPSHAMDIIAITGTNGKTSTAWWLAQALAKLDPAGAAMIGTLGVGRFVNSTIDIEATGLTTPDPVLLQHYLRLWVNQNTKTCVMEASSIGIEEHRLDATRVHTAVFTNFTQDHLDYHGSMQDYWQAKHKLFSWPELQAAVINIDDSHGHALATELEQTQTMDVWTLSCEQDKAFSQARLQALDIQHGNAGLEFMVQEQGGERVSLQTELIGQYNVTNLLGVLACLRIRGVSLAQAAKICTGLRPVPGRMQCIHKIGKPVVVVDYAHTPDALEKVLLGLRPLALSRNGQLWCVFGGGGDRDPFKRPLMGAVAARLADIPFITSDNPRSEDPKTIMMQIRAGMPTNMPALRECEDRATAIATAITQANVNDVILLAGKGHENYQEIHGVKRPFSDEEQAQAALIQRTTEEAV